MAASKGENKEYIKERNVACQWSPSHRHVIISSSGRFFLASSRGENCWKTKEKILTFIFENKHLALRVVFENAAPAFFFPLCPYKASIPPALWLLSSFFPYRNQGRALWRNAEPVHLPARLKLNSCRPRIFDTVDLHVDGLRRCV